tara:strand:+ start:4852 stop:6195 length:1344 start_codon:yes stop_codon:yes gene_type:complete
LKLNENFIWGTATSSYQIEGAYDKDGKGKSVWDTFSRQSGKIKNGDNGNVACNHYELWKNDVKLLKNLGVNAYRFSISWSRIFPNSSNKYPNMKGIDFYQKLLDNLLENDITPFITLNHWDIPQWLEDIGGWSDRNILNYFVNYADTTSKYLGDRVNNWITHNEPWCISNNGYLSGVFPPGIVNNGSKYFASIHHLLLSHGMSIPIIKENSKNCDIGITLNLCPSYPASQSKLDKEASYKFDGKFNRLYLDPLYKGIYPTDIIEEYLETNLIKKNDLEIIKGNDLNVIKTKTDFLGVNYYSRAIIRDNKTPNNNLPIDTFKGEETQMGWEIYPSGLYDLLKRLNNDYNINKIYITESGCSFDTSPDKKGIINDKNRIDYHEKHILQLKNAINDGVPCLGYFAWSLMDNFEWCEGYSQRFGLIWIDYITQQRIPKSSYWWYKKFIANN